MVLYIEFCHIVKPYATKPAAVCSAAVDCDMVVSAPNFSAERPVN